MYQAVLNSQLEYIVLKQEFSYKNMSWYYTLGINMLAVWYVCSEGFHLNIILINVAIIIKHY